MSTKFIRYVIFSQNVFNFTHDFLASSCLSLPWFLLSPSALQRTLLLDKRLLFRIHGLRLTRMSNQHEPFSPSYGVSRTVLMVLLNNLQSGMNNVLITAVNLSSLAGNIDVVVPAVAPGYVIYSCYVCALFLSHHPLQ